MNYGEAKHSPQINAETRRSKITPKSKIKYQGNFSTYLFILNLRVSALICG